MITSVNPAEVILNGTADMPVNIATMGPNSTGLAVCACAQIAVASAKIMNNGGAGYFVNGIGINGVSSNITATNTVAVTSGVGSPGGLLTNGSTLTINEGSVTTIGAESDAFLFVPVTHVPTMSQPVNPGISAGDPTEPNTLTINNATVTSAADSFHVIGVPANITVSGSCC